MKNYYVGITVVFLLFFLVGCAQEFSDRVTKFEEVAQQTEPVVQQKDPLILQAEPYMEKIVYDDIELRSLAASVTKGCPSGDKECQLNKIYHYVVDNYDYYSDPRSGEFIQSPADTLKVKGGDCEDLTILMISLLENLGFKTYLVSTDNHAYALACGVDIDGLWGYIEQSIFETFPPEIVKDGGYELEVKSGKLFLKKSMKQTMALEPRGVWFYGGGDWPISEYLNIEYSISSSEPVGIYFVPSYDAYSNMADGESFNQYPSCEKEGIYKVSDSCDYMGPEGGIILRNADYINRAVLDMELVLYHTYSTKGIFSDETISEAISYYKLNGEQCVVLEATAGKYGFPGYASTTGKKIAIDPLTKEHYSLN